MNSTLLEPAMQERRAVPAGPGFAAELASAAGILQREKAASLMLRAWPWICGAMLMAMTADVLWQLGPRPRVALLGGVILLALGWLAAGAVAAWLRKTEPQQTARILEAREPRLGSKLINVLQLQGQTTDPGVSALTRELAGMAIAGYLQELHQISLPRLARSGNWKADGRHMLFGVAAFLALLGAAWPITRAEVPRFLDPFGDHPPFSFTQLEITEPANDAGAVVYGQNILITARSHGHRPGELFLSFFPPGKPEAATTVPMFDKGEHGFTQQIEGIKTDLALFVHTKDRHSESKQRRVAVILTPKLERATVGIASPAYTGLPPEERPLQFKSLKALEGSTLTFHLFSNRPLAQGRISVANASGTVVPVKMEPAAENEVVASLLAKESGQLTFSIVDRDGFESQETWSLALNVTHDLPPDVQITNPNGDTFVAIDFKVQPVIEASDDYGLRTLRIHQARNEVYGEPRIYTYEKAPLNARETIAFDFKAMGVVSGDRIAIFAEAIDNAPEPHLTRSKTVTLTVISTEEYNQFLRERTDLADIEAKYNKLINEFHERVEDQQKVGEQIEALKKELAEAKSDSEKVAMAKKAEELARRQRELNKSLNELAKKMETFVRDQPLYDVEAELKETLAQKAKEVRESTAENEEAMQKLEATAGAPAAPPAPSGEASPPAEAGKAQSTPSQKMLGEFKEASDAQLEKLGAVEKEAREQITQPLADLSLMHEIIKDINRFKDLYEAQKQLAEQSKAYARGTRLSREDQLGLKNLAGLEKEVGDQLDAVEQKLWEDGKAAMAKFPKAGQSAQGLAQKMGDLRLQSLAQQATGAMLEGLGERGAHLAENLRAEMDKLFSQCNGQTPGMNNELDQYLGIQRGMKAAHNFGQMMQTRKFGIGNKPGAGSSGENGHDGSAVMTGANASVMGSEQPISETERAQQNGNGKDRAKAPQVTPTAALDKEDIRQGLQPVNRESGAVQGEGGIEAYSDIVDKYFRAITKPGTSGPGKFKPAVAPATSKKP